jgi:hypothetical protein
VSLLVMLGLGFRSVWWLTTVLTGLGAAGALAFPFIGPEGARRRESTGSTRASGW